MIVTVILTGQFAERDECAVFYESIKRRLSDIPNITVHGTYSGAFELETQDEVPD